jgi:predicted O-methyltransferase YrrM
MMQIDSKYILSAPVRHIFMMGIVWYLSQRNGGKPIHILEIGSWYGASTLTWAQGLKEHNQNNGTITCIDAWEPYETMTPEMRKMAENSYEGFLSNTQSIRNELKMEIYRGKSSSELLMLRDARRKFDIIYIDGDHSYEGVYSDINLSVPLLTPNGIICGDDLNLQYHEINQPECYLHRNEDFIADSKTGKKYHPGVTLAVSGYFEDMDAWGGFWATQKHETSNEDRWISIDLKEMPIIYPEHFLDDKIAEARDHLRDIEI